MMFDVWCSWHALSPSIFPKRYWRLRALSLLPARAENYKFAEIWKRRTPSQHWPPAQDPS